MTRQRFLLILGLCLAFWAGVILVVVNRVLWMEYRALSAHEASAREAVSGWREVWKERCHAAPEGPECRDAYITVRELSAQAREVADRRERVIRNIERLPPWPEVD